TPADLFNVDNVQAIIGNGPFPLQEDADPINQMTVIGDTVYVAPGGSTNAGVFFSQALFGSDGKIVRWTPWSLRATPQTAFAQISSGQVTTGSVAFFAVDTTTGNLFMVDNETQTFAGVSSWITPQTTQTLNPITNEITQTLSPDLVSQVSNVLVNGCYCVLDLNSSTRGLQNTNQSYALFGGSDIVIFTVTGTTPQAGPPAVVTEDFTLPANFLATQLPQSGPVYLLAYTQQPTQNLDDENLGDINYFFAATQNGLFAFAGPNGQGFDAAVLSTLNMPPFSTGSWQKISSLPGIPVDIQCNGTNLYILMAKPQYNQATVYTIYNIDLEAKTNLSLLFAPENVQYIIAQTGVGIFENVSTFFGMQLIATGQESMITTNQANYERAQMVLATNQGFFVSQANQDPALSLTHALGITTAADQTAAAWTLIATPSPVAYSDVFSIATPVQHTVWTASIDDLYNFKTYDRSSIHQISGNGNATGSAALFTTFQPEPFNSNNPSVATLDPIINFWTDGARRFFTINQFTSPYFKTQIAVFPYNSLALGITAFSPLQNPTLDEIARFFFAQTVGPTGLVCVGTDSGIVALG
ncbi:MAG TPA: hypothetical protein VEK38_03645, partial [Candidatus Bathyarchaeia archaeon]|nr:hypothetical protein [Candidatus Bathyarchaeia archaeon]